MKKFTALLSLVFAIFLFNTTYSYAISEGSNENIIIVDTDVGINTVAQYQAALNFTDNIFIVNHKETIYYDLKNKIYQEYLEDINIWRFKPIHNNILKAQKLTIIKRFIFSTTGGLSSPRNLT